MKKFQHNVIVHWGDTDPAKIVFYPNYFAWFDESTRLFFDSVGLDWDNLMARHGVRGLPIVEVIGGRKNKDSLYTKLLSKRETIAAQIYDKVRFRIVNGSNARVYKLALSSGGALIQVGSDGGLLSAPVSRSIHHDSAAR